MVTPSRTVSYWSYVLQTHQRTGIVQDFEVKNLAEKHPYTVIREGFLIENLSPSWFIWEKQMQSKPSISVPKPG